MWSNLILGYVSSGVDVSPRGSLTVSAQEPLGALAPQATALRRQLELVTNWLAQTAAIAPNVVGPQSGHRAAELRFDNSRIDPRC
jgi:hypothetical protein